ncbi:hypothetical protein SeMB42_g01965 [Synchytrium endobioticum]|uniref:Uncharacterized protein n=1 Tax=Synchytrium endobioticum TaxID=286115 RepID=A0A507DI01_9FUNG|nr:hypothetical protein SeMB42_g01965 [Synchytrium endobioticum]
MSTTSHCPPTQDQVRLLLPKRKCGLWGMREKGAVPANSNDQVPPSSKISRQPVVPLLKTSTAHISNFCKLLFTIVILSVRPPST